MSIGRTFDVLAVGELNPDLILSGIHADGPAPGTEQLFDDEILALGSSTAIACVLMQRLGLSTAFCGLIGDDTYGRFCLDTLDAEGVNRTAVQVTPDGATGITVSVSYPTDRLLLTRPGTMTQFNAAHVDTALLARSRHLHVGSYFLQTGLRPGLAGLFAAARAAGCSTSLDFGWDPSGQWDRTGLTDVLALTDVVLPNRDELRAVTGQADIDAGLAALHDLGAREIALKLGKDGGLMSLAGTPPIRRAGHVVDVVDTTGAGDAFNAGYLAARLEGWLAEDRLRLANACGALTAAARGGTGGLRNRAQALDLAGLDPDTRR